MTLTRRTRTRERGIALVMVLFVMTLLLSLGAALHTGVINDTSLRGANVHAVTGFYAAESGIDNGMGAYRDIFLNYSVPSGSDFNAHTLSIDNRTVTYQLANIPGNPFTGIVVPAGRPFAGLNSTEYRYTAKSTSQLTAGDTEASIGTQFNVDYIPIFQFLAFYQNDLEMLPGQNALFHGPVHTNGNLYLNSDATMTIADCLTTGANPCPAPIPIVHMSAAGDVYRGRKDAATCNGTVNIAKLVDADHNGALDQKTLDCTSATATTKQTSATLALWLGSVLAKQPVVAVPQPGVLTRVTGDYWKSATLRIVLDLTSPDANGRFPFEVQNVDGTVNAAQTAILQAFMAAKPGRLFYNDVPTKTNTTAACNPGAANTYCATGSYSPAFAAGKVYACAATDLNLFGGCANYIANDALSTGGVTARRGGFYNNREHAWVYMLNLNLHDFLAWNRAQAVGNRLFDPDVTTDGGVVMHLTVQGPNSNVVCTQNPGVCPTPRYGVRVFGSPNLDFAPGAADPTGVTVVSDMAIYIEGDYNNGTGACSFGGAGTCPKMPAAFMGDTINVLSDTWSGAPGAAWIDKNDAQSYQPLATRVATAAGASTVIYAAFISGVDTTIAGQYNGGLENYPRMHETWGGTLMIRGSFVSLGAPQHANGIWCGTGGSCTIGAAGCGTTASCNIYNPPTRAWDYDTDFQTVANLPPLTPRFVTVQQILFTENFR